MESPNHTFLDSSVFFLVGIPGLEQFHLWLSLPVCCLGTATIVGNITILVIIATEPALHKPVYLFLCMLSTVDLAASFSTVPAAGHPLVWSWTHLCPCLPGTDVLHPCLLHDGVHRAAGHGL